MQLVAMQLCTNHFLEFNIVACVHAIIIIVIGLMCPIPVDMFSQ